MCVAMPCRHERRSHAAFQKSLPRAAEKCGHHHRGAGRTAKAPIGVRRREYALTAVSLGGRSPALLGPALRIPRAAFTGEQRVEKARTTVTSSSMPRHATSSSRAIFA